MNETTVARQLHSYAIEAEEELVMGGEIANRTGRM